MKRYFIICLLSLLSFSVTTGQTNSTQPEGSGTEADPYKIESLGNLSWLTQSYANWNKFYIQTVDINASETTTWDDSDDNSDGDRYNDPNDLTDEGTNGGWLPIETFIGLYDGGGYLIDSLTINRSNVTSGIGFIKSFSGISISGLGLTNINYIGGQFVGGLVGTIKEGVVEECYTTGTITCVGGGKYRHAGFVGFITTGVIEITNCYSKVNITAIGNNNYLGGFVGNIKGVVAGSIENCYATGDVLNGGESTGGFVGKNEDPDFLINRCYSTGNVTNIGGYAGGFAGDNADAVISECYSTGNVSSTAKRVGGFLGYNKTKESGGTISNCYSLGNVTRLSGSEVSFGGFCGQNKTESTIENSYSTGSVLFLDATDSTNSGFVALQSGNVISCLFDSTASNQSTSSTAIGKTTTEMMTEATFTDLNWDFNTIWKIVDSNYPTFIESAVSVEKNEAMEIPNNFELKQNYPNPFNPSTIIAFALPKASNITLSVYNIIGEKVAELVNGKMAAGNHTVNFNASTSLATASNLVSGIYIYRISAGNFVATKKMILLK